MVQGPVVKNSPFKRDDPFIIKNSLFEWKTEYSLKQTDHLV